MQIIDISKDILCTEVYPGDPPPKITWLSHTQNGDLYTVSQITMCSHTGTHIDSPFHISTFGNEINQTDLSVYYGDCSVITFNNNISETKIKSVIQKCKKRLLIRGGGTTFLSQSIALLLAKSNIILVGTDADSVGYGDDELNVHKILLENNIAILENLNLSKVHDGDYILCAFPLKIKGLEATPTRAVLIEK